MTEVLALIPARGGSKSIPRKNIRPFAGHPLIAFSIAAGLTASTITRIIVSTEDEEIAVISRLYGAETPFLRPIELSEDDTPDLPVFQHALQWLEEKESYRPEIVVQLRPTSPLRRVWHIDQAVSRLLECPDADSIRTICIPFQNPFKMWRIESDGFMKPLASEIQNSTEETLHSKTNVTEAYNMPRQLLPEIYWQTGYVDAFRSSTILENKSMTGGRILPLLINPNEWIDIDTPSDWHRAEQLLEFGEINFDDLGFQLP